MKELTKREKEVLIELLKGARTTDQEIARRIKTSRPTIAKIRNRLEEKRIILGYNTYVDFEKLGLHVNALTIFKWNDYSKTKELKDIIYFIKNLPEVIVFIRGEGLGGKSKTMLSVHRDLREYEIFIRNLQEKWGPNVTEVDSFLSSIDTIHKRYDLSRPALNILNQQHK
ncbi:winged helix-turn-helix transcriptional regulator [Candidatus Woesearchaeota archaeon]|nr:winged helix-turn-helix transcriptional regulator [Candidatus Woesearchaeota archaeon]